MQSQGVAWDSLVVLLSTAALLLPMGGYGVTEFIFQGGEGGYEEMNPARMQVNKEAFPATAHPLGEWKFSYGTAGFRTKGDRLEPAAYRMGMLMVCRAILKQGSVGVMLSASHNQHEDNGMKLVDFNGAMLDATWEPIAEDVANTPTQDLPAKLESIISKFQIEQPSTPPTVYIGMDTRLTGPSLSTSLKSGITAAGGVYHDYGVVTTPQLHFFVWKTHVTGKVFDVSDYKDIAVSAFKSLVDEGKTTPKITIDCSNGVGFLGMKDLAESLPDKDLYTLVNGDVVEHEKLNHLCGGDFVQKEKRSPTNVNGENFVETDHVAAFDGDADRLVYFYYKGTPPQFHLLDGDRIAVLYAKLIKKYVDELSLKPTMAIIQTAYANGASTAYMRDTLGTEVVMTPTGVKHLHHKAVQFDIGVYFEANGHGTVVFSTGFLEKLQSEGSEAASKLIAVSSLVSPVCGDAMLDMLLCEAALANLGWSIQDWASLYVDAPSRMTKVQVPNPSRVKNTWDQTKATEPEGMQAAIDAVVAEFHSSSRSFVRPSGTEPIVRVYAEADTQENADRLAAKVEDVVRKFVD